MVWSPGKYFIRILNSARDARTSCMKFLLGTHCSQFGGDQGFLIILLNNGSSSVFSWKCPEIQVLLLRKKKNTEGYLVMQIHV